MSDDDLTQRPEPDFDDRFGMLFSDSGITSHVSGAEDAMTELEALRTQVEELEISLNRAHTTLDEQVEQREQMTNELHRLRRQLNETRAVVVDTKPSSRMGGSGALPALNLPPWLNWAKPPVFENDEFKSRTAFILNIILLAFVPLIFTLTVLVVTLPGVLGYNLTVTFIIGSSVAGLGAVLYFIMRRGYIRFAAVGVLIILYLGITFQVFVVGTIRSPLTSAYAILIALAGLLIGQRTAIIATIGSLLTIFFLMIFEMAGLMAIGNVEIGPVHWVTFAIVFVMLLVVLQLNIRGLQDALFRVSRNEAALEQSNRQLQAVLASTEAQVAERTRDFQLANDVVRAISTELNPQQLMNRVVQTVRETFNLYYVGLFLVNAEENLAELRAGTGEAGQRMLAVRHRLPIGSTSMIGAAIANRQARITGDVRKEDAFYANPYLPFTRSEMALPLISRDRVIGALTIQSIQPNDFGPSNTNTLQIMADLIAVSLDNTILFERSQQLLSELESAQRTQIADSWSSYLDSHTTTVRESFPGIEDVMRTGNPQIFPSTEGTQGVTVPLQLRSEVIGALNLETEEGNWSEDDLALVAAVADQAALALDNMRLIEETQRGALREQMINAINEKVLRAPDIETVIKTTLIELTRTLNVPVAIARVGTEADLLRGRHAGNEEQAR